MLKKLYLIVLLSVVLGSLSNFALACSCGCKGNNCGAASQQTTNPV